MGIELHLDIMPSRITPEAWSKVYSDSLVLTDNYPFMDKYYGYRDNGLEYIYGAHTRERDDIYGRFRGWRSVGDLWTGYNTEEFALKANIEDYRRHGAKDEGDMVASLVYGDADEYPELNIPEADSMVSAFYAKTQGEDSHLYLLAIACMVADRLPGAAVVSGDINAGQCRAAVNWANQYLSEPIMVPVQCDAVRLMHRILLMDGASQLMEDGRILDLFFRISLENRDARMGDVLRKRVSEKVIATYYHRKFSGAQKNGLPALERETKEYLELGFDLRHLLGVLVTDPDGCRLQLDDFLDMILGMQLHVQDKMTYDMTQGDKENSRPDDVGMLFARIFGRMAGAGNRNVDAYYSLEEITSICKDAMGSQCDVDAKIKEALERDAEGREQNDTAQSFFYGQDSAFSKLVEKQQKNDEAAEQYDIRNMDEIVYYETGDTFAPELEEALKKTFAKLHTFAEGEEFDVFRQLSRDEREAYFVKRNRNILIHQETWERIFDRIMDDDYIKRFYAVFRIDTSMQKIYDFTEAILINLDLLDYFWEGTSA